MEPRNTNRDLRVDQNDESSNPELSQEIDGFLKTSDDADDDVTDEPVLDDEDLEENDLTDEDLDDIEWEEETPRDSDDETR